MKRRGARALLGALALTLGLIAARPLQALPHDPFLGWSTLSSGHFDVHYHAGLEALAPRTAAICERRFAELAAYFGFQPADRIQVVLADETDEANGETSAYPYETVFLIVAPPDDEEAVYDIDAWLEYLVSHELTHAFHLDHARGVESVLRGVFGRGLFTLPAYIQPDWVIEGLATWAETAPARGVGRGQGPLFEGMMRLEVEDGFKPIRRVNEPQREWPGGMEVYLYGVYFMEFLEATYGKDSIRQWVESYSGYFIPYCINLNALQVFGKQLPALWKDYRAWIGRRMRRQIRAIEAAGLRGAPADVESGGGDAWGPFKGGYAVRRDDRSRPRLQKLVHGRWQDLGDAFVSTFWPGKSRILYTEDEVLAQSRVTRDLWQLDLVTLKRARLTWGLRVQEAVETPRGVLAVLGSLGQKSLVRLDRGRVAETLWQGEDDENIASLCPSPDGGRLAASHWRRGQGWDIEEFDLGAKAWIPRASRPESEVHPSYSADGRFLFFSASYGGVYNIWALELATGRLLQVTNVVGGAFHPWQGRNGRVYFSLLTSKGYVLGVADFDPGQAAGDPGPEGIRPTPKPLALPPLQAPRPYSPWATLAPRSWTPFFSTGNDGDFYGAEVTGQDVLGRHAFDVLGYLQDGVRDAFGSAQYSYTRWLPAVDLFAARFMGQDFGSDSLSYRNRLDDQWGLSLDVPWQTSWRSWDAAVEAVEDLHRDHGGSDTLQPLAPGFDTGYALLLSYDSTDQPTLALGPVDGLQAELQATVVDPGLAGTGDWFTWTVGRPTSLGLGFELEDVLSGGRVEQGGDVFNLQNGLPQDFLRSRHLSLQPRYSFTGYQDGLPALQGPQFTTAHLALRVPLLLADWGLMAPPVAVDRVHARLWAESAEALDAGLRGQPVKDTLGAELDVDHIVFYSVGLRLQIGYAWGLDSGGLDGAYVNLVEY